MACDIIRHFLIHWRRYVIFLLAVQSVICLIPGICLIDTLCWLRVRHNNLHSYVFVCFLIHICHSISGPLDFHVDVLNIVHVFCQKMNFPRKKYVSAGVSFGAW